MLHILKKHRIYPVVFFSLYTGMRMGETLSLTWKDVDLDDDIICVTKAFEFEKSKPKPKATKTANGIRDIPMPSVLKEYLLKYKTVTKKSLYVFPGHSGGPMGQTEIKRLWRKAKNRINNWFKNNEDMKEHQFNLTFRLLRHTYCTGLYDADIDELSAAKLMGHDVVIMRKIYTHLSEKRKKKTTIKLESLYQDKDSRERITELQSRQ